FDIVVPSSVATTCPLCSTLRTQVGHLPRSDCAPHRKTKWRGAVPEQWLSAGRSRAPMPAPRSRLDAKRMAPDARRGQVTDGGNNAKRSLRPCRRDDKLAERTALSHQPCHQPIPQRCRHLKFDGGPFQCGLLIRRVDVPEYGGGGALEP